MSAAKTLFLRDAELVKASLAIVKSDDFAKLIMYSMAEFASRLPTTDQLIGANQFVNTLRGMVDSDEMEQVNIGPDLNHDLDVKRKSIAEPTQQEKK